MPIPSPGRAFGLAPTYEAPALRHCLSLKTTIVEPMGPPFGSPRADCPRQDRILGQDQNQRSRTAEWFLDAAFAEAAHPSPKESVATVSLGRRGPKLQG